MRFPFKVNNYEQLPEELLDILGYEKRPAEQAEKAVPSEKAVEKMPADTATEGVYDAPRSTYSEKAARLYQASAPKKKSKKTLNILICAALVLAGSAAVVFAYSKFAATDDKPEGSSKASAVSEASVTEVSAAPTETETSVTETSAVQTDMQPGGGSASDGINTDEEYYDVQNTLYSISTPADEDEASSCMPEAIKLFRDGSSELYTAPITLKNIGGCKELGPQGSLELYGIEDNESFSFKFRRFADSNESERLDGQECGSFSCSRGEFKLIFKYDRNTNGFFYSIKNEHGEDVGYLYRECEEIRLGDNKDVVDETPEIILIYFSGNGEYKAFYHTDEADSSASEARESSIEPGRGYPAFSSQSESSENTVGQSGEGSVFALRYIKRSHMVITNIQDEENSEDEDNEENSEDGSDIEDEDRGVG